MKSASLSAKYSLLSQSGLASGLLRRSVLRQLQQLRHGHLRIYENGELLEFGDSSSALTGEVEVLDAAFWGMVAGNGSIGAGEAYIHGMNGITEAVRQVRGTSCNQVPGVEHVLVTSGTGVPTSGLILGRA